LISIHCDYTPHFEMAEVHSTGGKRSNLPADRFEASAMIAVALVLADEIMQTLSCE
jgi:hypothetical protein